MGHNIDQEVKFGLGASGKEITPPNPWFCNLKLNVMRVLQASGAAQILERFWRDYDDVGFGSSGLGITPGMDNLFFDKLATINVS